MILFFFEKFALVIEMTGSVSSGFKKITVSSINKKQGGIYVFTPATVSVAYTLMRESDDNEVVTGA